jgi:hypothetical protein
VTSPPLTADGPTDDEVEAALDRLARQHLIDWDVAADSGDVLAALRLAGYRIVRHHRDEAP